MVQRLFLQRRFVLFASLSLLALAACEKKESSPSAQAPPAGPAGLPHDAEAAAAKERPARLTEAARVTHEALASALRMSDGSLTCEETQVMDSVRIQLRGREDFYPLGAHALTDAPKARELAQVLALMQRHFGPLQSPPEDPIGIGLQVEILGSADANPMAKPVRYRGRNLQCESAGRAVQLNPDFTRIDNSLLGCARSAAVASELLDAGLDARGLIVRGRELTTKGGDQRFIEVTVVLRNVLRLTRDVSICP